MENSSGSGCRGSRFNQRPGGLESRPPSVYFYTGMGVVEAFSKEWQNTERIRCQDYLEQLFQARIQVRQV